MHDVLIIIIAIIALTYLFSKKAPEHFSVDNQPQTNEALQNLASVYNAGNIVVSELTATRSFNLLPPGIIVAWGGSTVPTGWALCDGTNGTPDLRNRFILGATGNSGRTTSESTVVRRVGDIGGSENVTLTVNQLPAHTHAYTDVFWSEVQFGGWDFSNITFEDNPQGYGNGGGTDRDNKGWAKSKNTSPTGTGAPVSILPPFYVLTYIIKT